MAPEHSGFPIVSYVAPADTRIYTALDESYQIAPVSLTAKNPGKFSSTQFYNSEEYLRDKLAIKYEFKQEITHVQEYLIAPGTRVQESVVGPQLGLDGKTFFGGGNQIEILRQPNTRTGDFLVPVGDPIPVVKTKIIDSSIKKIDINSSLKIDINENVE